MDFFPKVKAPVIKGIERAEAVIGKFEAHVAELETAVREIEAEAEANLVKIAKLSERNSVLSGASERASKVRDKIAEFLK